MSYLEVMDWDDERSPTAIGYIERSLLGTILLSPPYLDTAALLWPDDFSSPLRGERTPLGMTEPDETLASLEFASLPEAVVAADIIVNGEAPKVFVDPKAAWRRAPASEKQLEVLRKRRVPFQPGITKGEASILIDKAFSRGGVMA